MLTAPSQKSSIELIANSPFPGNWATTGPQGDWELNASGELVQKSLVGSGKAGTGALLAQKDPLAFPVYELKLACRPGSQHKTGLLFGLVDEDDFCIFCIDQHSKNSLGYDLLAFEVRGGKYKAIFKESYKITRPETLTFTLRQEGPNLVLLFNEAPAYTWANMPLFGKKIGLYSYKNNDAAFLSMSLTLFPEVSTSTQAKPPEAPPKTANEIVAAPPAPIAAPAPVIALNGITPFLNIKPPASKTEIEFTEVFTVPLDSFYASLYQSKNLDKLKQLVEISTITEVQSLDLRIKRWYRDLKAIRDQLTFTKDDLARKKARVKDAENQLADNNLDDDTYKSWEIKLRDRRADYKTVLRSINDLRDQEGLVLREVRINGYAVEEHTTIEAIKALDYDFHIVSQTVMRSSYDPIRFEADLDLANDEVWRVAEQQLYHRLFDSGTISEKGAALYPKERDQLTSFEACAALVESADLIQKDIQNCNGLRPVYEGKANDAEKEISEWKADSEALLAQKQRSPATYAPTLDWDATHQAAIDGVGWLESSGTPVGTETPYPPHPQFESRFLPPNRSLGKRYRLKRFVADAYFYSVKPSDPRKNPVVDINYVDHSVVDGMIQTALAIQCPVETGLPISFYHTALATYDAFTERIYYTNIPNYASSPVNFYLKVSLTTDTFSSSQSLHGFFDTGVQVCDYYIGRENNRRDSAIGKLQELAIKVAVYKEQLAELQTKGLSQKRLRFLLKWDDPASNLTAPSQRQVHYPDDDPLAKFLASISGHGGESASAIETYFFAPTPDGFYNQNGLSLQKFMKAGPGSDIICVFPVFDMMGGMSGEMVKAVRNPSPSNKDASLPTIKFVESYRVEVGWLGYGLGELSHSFNLFPGESKELVVEKSTKLKTKLEESRKTAEETISKLNSSFEDNLQNEFSIGEKAAQESASTAKGDSSQTRSSEDSNTSESSSTQESNFQASASGGMFGFSASASGGSKWGSSSKNTAASKRNSAWAASQSAEEKRANNQSKDILSKDVSNAVRKVASETSQNNKLEFSAVSSREYEESTSNREVIKLQNPNVGKTVNYNFFQVQNLFGVSVKLIDVQVVIDSGVEMVNGTDINDVRVHNLEEFGKIYANSDGSDRAAALAAIVARQVMKHYGNFLPGVTSGNGAIGVGSGFPVEREMIEVLNFSDKEFEIVLKERIERIKTALDYLKGVPFQFRETVLSEEATVAVNCAAYHVESQLGFLNATEPYLEVRREIETEKQRAQVAHLKAQTEAKVFYPELPEGITSLNMDGKGNNLANTDSQRKS